ncbi:MAG: hypothetical protein SNJ64_06660 [Endomicrobiia bacterium]
MNKVFKTKVAPILSNKKIACETYLLSFSFREKFFPTQFLMLDTYPKRFLLKPFTITDYDNKKGIVSIIYRLVGDGTKFLSEKKVGEKIKFLGPFGNKEKFRNVVKDLERLKDYEKFVKEEKLKKIKENKIVLLAGGSGVASVIYLYKELSKINKNIEVYYGESDEKYVVDLKKFGLKNVVYTTDNGSCGNKGLVTDIFVKEMQKLKVLPEKITIKDDKIQKIFSRNNLQLTNNQVSVTIFACGPRQMLKSLQNIVRANKDINCYVLLEEYMCCGVGVCRGCVVKTTDKELKVKSEKLKVKEQRFVYQTVCKDGPMFDIKKIIL